MVNWILTIRHVLNGYVCIVSMAELVYICALSWKLPIAYVYGWLNCDMVVMYVWMELFRFES